MKRIAWMCSLGLLSLSISASAQDKPAAVKPADPPKAEKAEAPKTVAADPDFAQQYDQVMALQKLIQDVEQENGITKMRERSQRMIGQLQAWTREHKVEGWHYDPSSKTFTENKKQERPAAAPAGK